MNIRSEEVRRAIDDFCLNLIETGIAIDMNKAVCLGQPDRKTLVTWASAGISTSFTDYEFATLNEYLQFIEARQFSALLFDGALLQISYTVHRDEEVVDHRLCWYPCPVHLTREDLEVAPIEEIVRSTPVTAMRCRGPVRFDFSPHQTKEGHSSSHLHVFQEGCRVPVKGPLDLYTFSNFVLSHFYPKPWAFHKATFAAVGWGGGCTLTAAEFRSPHLFWNNSV